MTEYRRIFLSYTPQDTAAVTAIASDLKQQGFEIWEYATRWKKTDAGHDVPDEFSDLMHRASWFVPIVSTASTNPLSSITTCRELEYALELDMLNQKRIIPILLTNKQFKKWIAPFDTIEHIYNVPFDLENTRTYLHSIAALCNRLNVSYKPILCERPLIPYWKKFSKEVKQIHKKIPDSWKLMPVITEFNHCWESQNWNTAHDCISYFYQAIRYTGVDLPLPYLLAIKAICEMKLNKYSLAEESLSQALKSDPDSREIAGVAGYYHMGCGNVNQAKEILTDILKKSESTDLRDNFFYLYPLSLQGYNLSAQDKNMIQKADQLTWPSQEFSKLLNLLGLALYQNREYKKVINLYESTDNKSQQATLLVIYTHFSYKKIGEPAEAETVLTSFIRNYKNNPECDITDVYYYLAEYYYEIGEARKALSIYEKHLIRSEVFPRKLHIRFAQILKFLGDQKRMKIECTRLLSSYSSIPMCCEDFYYNGFAQFLLGNNERAMYDYERSNRYGKYYSLVN